MNISRKTFLKAVGLTLFATTSVITTGCQEKLRRNLSFSELDNYEIITCAVGRGKIAMYTIYSGSGGYLALDLSGNSIEEYLIYDINFDEEANKELSIHENFVKSLNITSFEPALVSLEKNIGLKEVYTIKELQDNLNKFTNKLNNQKTKALTR